ncbi:uncharacterized protein LOC142229189 [Haematobia irritans]|uniref:uncharacterized protein LOC142229189 n=1 Tax=Haematobia irritans TaxID=7368 RepID=UPI003F50C9D8
MENSHTSTPKCRICYKWHTLKDCPAFYNMDVHKRRQEVKEKRFCYKCLCSSHTRDWCRSRKTCMVCNHNHHTMLHIDDHKQVRHTQQSSSSNSHRNSQSRRKEINRRNSRRSSSKHQKKPRRQLTHSQRSPPLVHERLSQRTKIHVFLPTALARLLSPDGPGKTRLMFNSAGLRTYILESLVQRYNLQTTRLNGDEYCTLSLQSFYDSSAKIQITGVVQRRLNVTLPETTEDKQFQSVYGHLDLADPHFYNPVNIEVIIGNDQLSKILLAGLIQTTSSMPIAQSSIFGWVISGACRR